jgi:hypothetical protein
MSVVPVRVGLDFDPIHVPRPGGETSAMCTAAVPASASEVLRMLPSLLRVLAAADPAGQPAEVLAEGLRTLEQAASHSFRPPGGDADRWQAGGLANGAAVAPRVCARHSRPGVCDLRHRFEAA